MAPNGRAPTRVKWEDLSKVILPPFQLTKRRSGGSVTAHPTDIRPPPSDVAITTRPALLLGQDASVSRISPPPWLGRVATMPEAGAAELSASSAVNKIPFIEVTPLKLIEARGLIPHPVVMPTTTR